MSRISDALEQLDTARKYTAARVDTVPQADWFTVPPGGVSHVAWQVGHIAMAEYRLCLERLRPRTPADAALVSDEFLKLFARGSVPGPRSDYPPAAEIREVYDRVHARVMDELPAYPDADLDREPLIPHPLYATRIASLRYAPLHEMLHCGQIAMIRRMLGHKPVW
ncbi:DinB family protein [Gemmata sp.]|uniref:DinB family protein n=1 Tax=Gemmata sp. TaxID=1914242 RepID=UPI003F72DADF